MSVRFLSVQDIHVLHQVTLQRDGGDSGTRDPGLLESAVGMPRQQFGGDYLHDGVPAMAAAYLYHLVMNHGFVDGNKRVGMLACLAFLRANGMRVRLDSAQMEDVTLKVAAGEMGKDQLTVLLQEFATVLSTD